MEMLLAMLYKVEMVCKIVVVAIRALIEVRVVAHFLHWCRRELGG